MKKNDQWYRSIFDYAFRDYIEDIWFFFSVKDRNLFLRVDTICNILKSGEATSEKATSENITDGVHEMK